MTRIAPLLSCLAFLRLTFERKPLIFSRLSFPWFIFILVSLFVRTCVEWGFPILCLLVPAIFYQFTIKCDRIKKFVLIAMAMQILLFSTYLYALFIIPKRTRGNWPSYELASVAQQFWVDHNHSLASLKYSYFIIISATQL